jgi:hypothetical protein
MESLLIVLPATCETCEGKLTFKDLGSSIMETMIMA